MLIANPLRLFQSKEFASVARFPWTSAVADGAALSLGARLCVLRLAIRQGVGSDQEPVAFWTRTVLERLFQIAVSTALVV